jgi:hypothetical protein
VTVPWATTLPFPVVAAALDDGQLLVGGNVGTTGMLATVAPASGAVASVVSFANAQLHRLTAVADGALWVAGPATGGVFAGRLTDACLTATFHGSLAAYPPRTRRRSRWYPTPPARSSTRAPDRRAGRAHPRRGRLVDVRRVQPQPASASRSRRPRPRSSTRPPSASTPRELNLTAITALTITTAVAACL